MLQKVSSQAHLKSKNLAVENIQLTYVSENRLDNDIIPRTIKYYQQIIDIKY